MVKKQDTIYDAVVEGVSLYLLTRVFVLGLASAQSLSNTLLQSPRNDAVQVMGSSLYLDVTLNGNPMGLVHLGYANDKLYAHPSVLRQLGLRLPDEGMTSVCLNDISQLNVDYNAQQQTLGLTVPLDALDVVTTQIVQPLDPQPELARSRGALLNYDLYAQQGKVTHVNSFSEGRIFNAAGVLSSTQLLRLSSESRGTMRFDRLDTHWRSSFSDSLLVVTFGDMQTSSLPWTRSTRLAGIQVGTDFSLDPYMPTTPLPAFLGAAVLPSRVELYVNGLRSYNGNVPAGNFQLNTLPTISGAGKALVTITDALGRATIQDFAFYHDPQLLREGLTAWSAELGVVRENYGYSSFDYASQPTLSGTWQRGLSHTLTTRLHL